MLRSQTDNVSPPAGLDKQCPAIPGVWRHCPQCPIAPLAAEDDVHMYHKTPEPQFEPSNMVLAALCVTMVVVCVVAQGEQAVACNPRTWGHIGPVPHGGPSC